MKFSHADPQYIAALKDMGARLRKLMDDKNWSRADLTRAAAKHMPEGGRFGADNTSNFVNGKRKPTRPFVKALPAALGVPEEEFIPPYLREEGREQITTIPLLSEVPGRKGFYRVFIDRELMLKDALRIVEALEEISLNGKNVVWTSDHAS